MLHKRELALLVNAFWKGGRLPLDKLVFVRQHELVDLLQTGEDLEEIRPKHDSILDCGGSGLSVEKLAQIPAVRIFQYQRVRVVLLERSVEPDYVGR